MAFVNAHLLNQCGFAAYPAATLTTSVSVTFGLRIPSIAQYAIWPELPKIPRKWLGLTCGNGLNRDEVSKIREHYEGRAVVNSRNNPDLSFLDNSISCSWCLAFDEVSDLNHSFCLYLCAYFNNTRDGECLHWRPDRRDG